MEKNPDLCPILRGKIEEGGIIGFMAFFQATWDPEKGLKVNPFVVLPPEIW
jgi:hypothetical protein